MTSVISVDAMGGDNGLAVTIPACIRFLNEFVDASLVLSGDEESVKKALGTDLERFGSRIRIVHATQVVEMDEQPQIAMRKRASSMRLAINEVKDGSAHAVVSAGNTGALMATARYALRTLDGIDRPAIAKMMPTVSGEVCVLDLGANVECDPVHLLQFGVMGSQLMKAVSDAKISKLLLTLKPNH
jgi:glycerol-3-phosphate acyltransferase PlsX